MAATTSTPLPVTTWFREQFVPLINSDYYLFLQAYEDHVNALNYSAVTLECVEAVPKVDAWYGSVAPVPDEVVQGLVDDLFAQLNFALASCLQSRAPADWVVTNKLFQELADTIGRIVARVQDT